MANYNHSIYVLLIFITEVYIISSKKCDIGIYKIKARQI